MRKKVSVIAIIILIIIGIICISQLKKSEDNGNLANMGLVCQSKGVVYYNKYEKGIFARKNGKESQLTDETAYSLNIVNDKIYYMTVADFNHVVIKSVDIDGRNIKSLTTIYTSISKIYVTGQAIYYSTNETGKGLAKTNLNGENEEVILPENVQDFCVAQDSIYYVNGANQIYKISLSGGGQTLLSDNAIARKLQVIDNWIYYYNPNENALFRLKKDGKKNELVSVLIHNESYNIAGQYVYYFDSENNKIARMKIGKSNQCDDIVFLNVSKTKINLAGNELYYLDKSEDQAQNYQIYRIKVNGKEAEKIEY